jgi:DNA mismatch repair protein MutL
VLDIEPELPQEQSAPTDSMAAWNSVPNAQMTQAPKSPEEQPEMPPHFADEAGQTALYEPDEADTLHYVGEIFKTYILAQRGEELCVIDKHAAHERQLFEKLAADYGAVPGQLLLAPVTVNLSAEEKQAVLDNQELLENAGLEVSDFGGSTVVLRTVPADVEPADAEDLLVELAAKLAAGSRDALNERTEWVLHSIACRAAVKAGDRTSPAELLALAEKILAGEVPPFCPHGRPCVLKLTRKELEKQFGRIV